MDVTVTRTHWPQRVGAVGALVMVAGLATFVALALTSLRRDDPPPLPAGVAALDLETDFRHCIGAPDAAEHVLTAYRLQNGPVFWDAFPQSGKAPELEAVRQELVIVVYRDGWPGATLGQFGTFGGERGPLPGTVDVCAETTDGSDGITDQPYVVYANVPVADSLVAHLVSH